MPGVYVWGIEDGTASCAAVLFSPRTDKVIVFGFVVPEAIVKE